MNHWKFALVSMVVALWTLAGCTPPDDEDAVVVVTINNGASNNTGNNETSGGSNNDGNNTSNNRSNDGGPCVDDDGDGYGANCADGADCDDTDASIWSACTTCVDGDGDGWYGECDVYDGVDGPDCDDADDNAWMACASCVDEDGDGYFVGCDAFTSFEEDCDDSASGVNAGMSEVEGNGVDDDCDPMTPDEPLACEYVPVPATNPEPGMLAGMTAAHNRWRWRVGLDPLTWNSELAASAQAYAEECIWAHDADADPDAGFAQVGENLAASSQSPTNAVVLDSVQRWADERYDFDYGFTTGQTTGGQVGHYTQIVWDGSNEVGCGFTNCPSLQGLNFGGTMVVCRYGPAGNYVGQQPYDYKMGACLDIDNDDKWQHEDPDDTDRSK